MKGEGEARGGEQSWAKRDDQGGGPSRTRGEGPGPEAGPEQRRGLSKTTGGEEGPEPEAGPEERRELS
ncbi:hypothetical protein CBR_g18688 [Chara braunii]|uniref:Uncharacterized protein n=1 Tax=Chara braunii TaxID=69332 RepID=A0A388KW53_CHABU|nr:hypothetical protein CBR_g18688 [Chara braunii]|eukprot:GBG74277.1 hypothetical protein CBR_g18688 [Chara braunii]